MKPGSKGTITKGNVKLPEARGECFAESSHLEVIDGLVRMSGGRLGGMARKKTCIMDR